MRHLEWIALLNAKRKSENQYMCPCPAHDDQHDSLSVNTADPCKTLIYCHAGCDISVILAAVGKEPSDLFTDPPTKPDTRTERTQRTQGTQASRTHPVTFEAIYDYTDEAGNLLARKTRQEGKKFSWSRPDGQGGWIYNRQGVPPVLYNLPAVAKHKSLFVVEGEKDVETLKINRFGAVSGSDGAGKGKWKSEYTEQLRGKNVAIVPDNDPVGMEYARETATALHGVAASVKLLDLSMIWPDIPEHGDITDLYEAQGEAGLLAMANLAKSTPEFIPGVFQAKELPPPEAAPLDIVSAQDLMSSSFAEKIHAVKMLIVDGLTFLVAASKMGKSWLVLLMALCVAKGEPFLGRETTKSRVLYFALEDSKGRLQSRLKAMGTTEIPPNLYFVTEAPLLEGGLEKHLEAWLAQEQGPALIIIDTFQKVRGIASGGVNAYQADYAIVGSIKAIADKHRAAILCIHHTNKAKFVADPYEKISGSNGIMGSADTIIMLDRERGSETATVKYTGRDVWGNDFVIRFQDCRWELVSNDANEYTAKNDYEGQPLVQLFRKLITENPRGGKWTYSNLQALGLEFLGYQPFINGKDCGEQLSSGMANELRKRDNILVEWGIRVKDTRGVRLQPIGPVTAFQTEMDTGDDE